MGLARKIAFTGIGSVVALVAVILIAQKTDILNKITSGLGNLGSSLGSGFGIGTRNAGAGFLYGLSGITPPNSGGILAPPVSPNPKTGAAGYLPDPSIGSDFTNFLRDLFRAGIPTTLPPADAFSGTGIAYNVNLEENLRLNSGGGTTLTKGQRTVLANLPPSMSDARLTNFQKYSNSVEQNRAIAIQNFNQGSNSHTVAIRGGYSLGSTATQARRAAGHARALARRHK